MLFCFCFVLLFSPFIIIYGEGHNNLKALKILYVTICLKHKHKNTRTSTQHVTRHDCNQLNLILSKIKFIKRLFKERFR